MEVLKESQKNKFDHLPDDVVLQILNKLWEAKWICRCSIVSKRFAFLVPCINNVSVKAPHYVSTWLEQEKWNNSVFDYLVGLKDIEYLHLEERFFGEADLESSWFPLLKWKTGDFNTNIKSFTFVKASSLNRAEEDDEEEEGEEEEEEEEEDEDEDDVDDEDEDEDEDGDEDEDEDEEDKRRYPVNIAFTCFKEACMRLNIALDMIGKHQKLRSITITDIEHQGKIVVSGDQISKLRDLEKKKLSMPKVNSGRIKLLLKYCRLPSLHLPKSKFMMALPTLFHIRWVNPSCNGGADVYDEMLAGSFDGDEAEVFNEAVEVILAKHKKEMSTEWIKKRGNARFFNLGLQ